MTKNVVWVVHVPSAQQQALLPKDNVCMYTQKVAKYEVNNLQY
jgi:hypothetical protein